MSKKKIAALLVAGIMTVGVVGGTLAWFTSKDSVTNVFNTGTTPGDRLDAGIEVDEKFPNSTNNEYNKPVLPGDSMVKEVWVESTANYDQFVRAKLVKNFYYDDEVVTHWAEVTVGGENKIVYGDSNLDNGKPLNLSNIQLELNNDNTWSIESGLINLSSLSETNWYYYNKVLKPHNNDNETRDQAIASGCETTDLLKSVTLSSNAGNEYKNLTFKVELQAESIQASNGAASASNWDTTVPAASITGYKEAE